MASRTLERTISEETTCSICCDQFKDPKMLPCQHTFCLKCLENVAKLNDPNTVDCPLCRKVYKVPTRGGVGRFKSNLLMKTLLEAKGGSPSNSSITEDEKFERKSQSQGFKNIVATPSAPPNYHHTTTSSQHSLIRGILTQSFSSEAKNFTKCVFYLVQFSGVIQNIAYLRAIKTKF